MNDLTDCILMAIAGACFAIGAILALVTIHQFSHDSDGHRMAETENTGSVHDQRGP